MADLNLQEKTVIELRKIAKEMKVPLGAGISKQGIIDKLTMAMAERPAPMEDAPAAPDAQDVPAAQDAPDAQDAPAAQDAPDEQDAPAAPDAPAAQDAPAAPAFRQAYVAPQRFNSKPAYQAPAFNRPGTPRPAAADSPRTTTTRPVGFSPRFGPAAAPDAAAAHDEDSRSSRADGFRPASDRRASYGDSNRFQQRPAYEQPRPSYEQRPAYEQPRPSYEQRPAYEQPRSSYEQHPAYEQPRSSYEQRPAYEQPRSSYEQRPAYEQPRSSYEQRPAYEQPRSSFEQRAGYGAPRREAPTTDAAPFTSNNPSISELISSTDVPECCGVLELLPEGYGFLRSEGMIPTGKDVYVASAQIRRFGLRTGDRVCGKMRPQRDGDKYPALLVVNEINGCAPDMLPGRPAFDEMTPIYPTRRISLESAGEKQYADLRLMDLITPIGFGQRGLIQCAPHTGKNRLLVHLANAVHENHPDAEVMMLLFNETPEDVTVIREQVRCKVLASTFDMPPENHLKLADLVLEHAERLVEMKRDVILLVDSLTTLTKVSSTAAMQQGRVIPGMINPASLQKAKRLFGAARCLREGGSLTVIATMNTDNGSKVDDSIINEFRSAANMELVLDQTLARAGVYPPMALPLCGTRRAEAILTPTHIEGLKLLRSMLGSLPAGNAIQELKSMMEKAPTNEELLVRIKAWATSMQG